MGLFQSKPSKSPPRNIEQPNDSTAALILKKITTAIEDKNVGRKISTVYELIREMDSQVNNQTDRELSIRIKKTKQNIYDFLQLTQTYVTEFQPHYNALEALQTKEWNLLDPQDVKEKTKSFLLSESPCLLEKIVERSTEFAHRLNSIVTEVIAIDDEMCKGKYCTSTKNWWLIGLGCACILGGFVCILLPMSIPMETFLVAIFLGAGGATLLTGAAFVTFGAMTRARLVKYSEALQQTSNELRELLAELHATVKDHQKIAAKMLSLSKYGVFYLEDAELMCATFRDLEKVFQDIASKKNVDVFSKRAIGVVSVVAGASAGCLTSLAISNCK